MPEIELAWTCYTPIVRAEAAYVHRAALAQGGEGFSEGVLGPLRAGAVRADDDLANLAVLADDGVGDGAEVLRGHVLSPGVNDSMER